MIEQTNMAEVGVGGGMALTHWHWRRIIGTHFSVEIKKYVQLC